MRAIGDSLNTYKNIYRSEGTGRSHHRKVDSTLGDP